MADTIDLIIKDLNGLVCSVTSTPNSLIADLKSELSTSLNLSSRPFRLIWQGEILEDHRTIASYNFSDGTILYITFLPATFTPKPAPLPDAGRFEAMTQNPLMKNILKSVYDHPEILTAMSQSVPVIERMTEGLPEMKHAMNDPGFLKDQLGYMMQPGALSRQLDRAFDHAEGNPRMEQMVRHQFDIVFDALKPVTPVEQTQLPQLALGPSDSPLPIQWQTQKVVPISPDKATQKVKGTLYTLKLFGVDLGKIPGLEILQGLMPPVDIAGPALEANRKFLGEEDPEIIGTALAATGGDRMEARRLLSVKRQIQRRRR
jgi:hypothetical protein